MISDLEDKFDEPFEFFVAEINKEIVGFIILENNEGKFWICNIMVKKNCQGQNIGEKLFNFAIKNKNPIYLWVNVKNPAIKFWERLGFKKVLQEELMIRKL